MSIAKDEYVALSSAAQECLWMQTLITELKNPPRGPTTILEDNINHLLQWPRFPSAMGEQNTLRLNIIYQGASEQLNG